MRAILICLILLGLGAGPRDMDRKPDYGLVSGVSFNRASAFDVAGNTWGTGSATYSGSVASFNGTSQWLQSSARIPTGSSWTVSVWAKFTTFTGTGANGVQYLVSQRSSSASGTAMEFEIVRRNPAVSNTIAMIFFNTSQTLFTASMGSVASLSTGTWYHFCAAFDGSTISAYRDGTLVEAVAFTGTAQAGAAHARLGNAGWFDGFPFNGSLDSFRAYSRALSATEIMQLYQSERNEARP